MKINIALACSLLTLTAWSPARGQEDTLRLTVDDAVELARANNPSFLATRNDEAAADWDVRAAYGNLLPFASLSGGLSWQDSGEQRFGSLTLAQNQPAYYLSNYNLGLSYRLDGRTLLEPSAARARRSATTAEIRAARAALEAAVTHGYLDVLRRAEGETLAARQLERARFNLRLARAQEEVGTVTRLDVRQAEVQVGRAEVVLLQARNALETARVRLLQRIGLDVDRPVELTSTFELAPPAWERETLLATALEHNPTLAARLAAADAGEIQVRQARSAYLPSLSASAGLSGYTSQAGNADALIARAQSGIAQQVEQCVLTNQIYRRLADPLPPLDCATIRFTDADRNAIITQNSTFPFDFTRQPASASLTLSLPLFQGLSRQREVEQARVRKVEAELQVREQRLALIADVSIALRNVSTAFQSAALEASNRAVGDEQLRLAGERYRVGAISFIDLVDAEAVKAEADQAYVDAVYAYHDAVAELEAVVGTPLRE